MIGVVVENSFWYSAALKGTSFIGGMVENSIRSSVEHRCFTSATSSDDDDDITRFEVVPYDCQQLYLHTRTIRSSLFETFYIVATAEFAP